MNGEKDFKIWEGILDEWPTNTAEESFSDGEHLERDKQRMLEAINSYRKREPNARINLSSQYPIPLLVAILSSKKEISVLDFGGGLGQTYLSILATVPKLNNLDYFIIEFGARAEVGRDLFNEYPNVKFISTLDDAPLNVDVLFLGSTLHYISDWKQLLTELTKSKPEYVVFGDLTLGDIKEFVTYQNFWEHKIPVRFFNDKSFIKYLKGLGYELIFDTYYQANIMGMQKPLPMGNFDRQYQLEYTRNLVFKSGQ